ncbi:hypothetical protein [Streptomyces gilvosporeus]|uniref:hypothetical protein n=1 Tax=Streptomyces gilvosporeus TaxID=553510 RepID=UPI003AAFEF50
MPKSPPWAPPLRRLMSGRTTLLIATICARPRTPTTSSSSTRDGWSRTASAQHGALAWAPSLR